MTVFLRNFFMSWNDILMWNLIFKTLPIQYFAFTSHKYDTKNHQWHHTTFTHGMMVSKEAMDKN